MKTFKLKLISPGGKKYEEEAATEVILPTPDGQISILPNHVSLISLLAPGEIVLKTGSREHLLVTEGGVVEVANNIVKILADTAEDLSSLDQLKIVEAKKKAEEMLTRAKDDVEFADAAAHLERQIAKLNFIKRRKKYRS